MVKKEICFLLIRIEVWVILTRKNLKKLSFGRKNFIRQGKGAEKICFLLLWIETRVICFYILQGWLDGWRAKGLDGIHNLCCHPSNPHTSREFVSEGGLDGWMEIDFEG